MFSYESVRRPRMLPGRPTESDERWRQMTRVRVKEIRASSMT